jgi:uridine kinase
MPSVRSPSPSGHASDVVLVAIAGGSGSGKTWLAQALRRRLGRRAALLSLDDFYRDLGHVPPARRARRNFDQPAAIDWPALAAVLDDIAAGGRPPVPRYDFSRHTRRDRPRRWSPRPVVLVEGLWPWVRPALRERFDLRIYRDAAAPLRRERRLERDVRERGRTAASVQRQWREQVEPMFRRHVAPQRDRAHVVVGGELPETVLEDLSRRILALLPGRRRC